MIIHLDDKSGTALVLVINDYLEQAQYDPDPETIAHCKLIEGIAQDINVSMNPRYGVFASAVQKTKNKEKKRK